jgi:hypothetical protein
MSEEGRRVLPSSKLLCDALPITHIFRKQQLAPSLVQVPTATFRGKPDIERTWQKGSVFTVRLPAGADT